jgi:cell division protein FtsW
MKITHSPDVPLLISTFVLVALGTVMVYSTTALSNGPDGSLMFVRKHLLSIVLGSLGMLVIRRLPSDFFYKISAPVFLGSIIVLAAVLIPGLGHTAGGATRWFKIGPMQLQPGEMIKGAFILYLSAYIRRHNHKMKQFVSGVVIPGMVFLLPASLLLLQPDFGTTAILVCVLLCELILVSELFQIVILGAVGAFGLGFLAWIEPYRMKRVIAFLDPLSDASASGYQLVQSLIAVGSGSLFGSGLGTGTQKLFYLPAAHTDFIFAVITEELGVLGALFVLLMFVIFAWSGLGIARLHLNRPFECALSVGATTIIAVPAMLNMGVVTGLLPTKGLVLPFVAYGGSAMVINLLLVGILLSLAREGREEILEGTHA